MLVLSEAPTLLLLALVASMPHSQVEATSFKMDFLSAGTVRTDPLMFSQGITRTNKKILKKKRSKITNIMI